MADAFTVPGFGDAFKPVTHEALPAGRWFVLVRVLEALHLDERSNTIVRDLLKASGYKLVSLWSYRAFKDTRVIPEAALYRLILRSRTEGAQVFREHLVQQQVEKSA